MKYRRNCTCIRIPQQFYFDFTAVCCCCCCCCGSVSDYYCRVSFSSFLLKKNVRLKFPENHTPNDMQENARHNPPQHILATACRFTNVTTRRRIRVNASNECWKETPDGECAVQSGLHNVDRDERLKVCLNVTVDTTLPSLLVEPTNKANKCFCRRGGVPFIVIVGLGTQWALRLSHPVACNRHVCVGTVPRKSQGFR